MWKFKKKMKKNFDTCVFCKPIHEWLDSMTTFDHKLCKL